MISFECKHCKAVSEFEDHFAGKWIKCKCGINGLIPISAQAPGEGKPSKTGWSTKPSDLPATTSKGFKGYSTNPLAKQKRKEHANLYMGDAMETVFREEAEREVKDAKERHEYYATRVYLSILGVILAVVFVVGFAIFALFMTEMRIHTERQIEKGARGGRDVRQKDSSGNQFLDNIRGNN